MTPEQDAFGRILSAVHEGRPAPEIVERDDGYLDVGDPGMYFATYRQWWRHEKAAMSHVRGRVLDVGAGAGRCALYLQQRGHEVVAIDLSPGAVEVCRRRGVADARLLSVTQVSRALGTFDTILMMGNNLGLLGTPARARWLLRRFRSMTGEDGRIVGSLLDPHVTEDPAHLAYHGRNRARGRPAGQLRLRVRSGPAASAWFDYLFLSPDELSALIEDAGWRVQQSFDSGGPLYAAVLEPAPLPRGGRTVSAGARRSSGRRSPPGGAGT